MIEVERPSILYESRRWAAEVPKILGASPDGRPIHIATVIRWITRGVRGRKLEAAKVGGRWMTSLEALERFCSGSSLPSSRHDGALRHEDGLQKGSIRRERAQQEREVEMELDRLGI